MNIPMTARIMAIERNRLRAVVWTLFFPVVVFRFLQISPWRSWFRAPMWEATAALYRIGCDGLND